MNFPSIEGAEGPAGIEGLAERGLLAGLEAMAVLLQAHGVEPWAERFREDLNDYLAADGAPQRVMAVVEHVLTAFGGMSEFRELQIRDTNGELLPDANEKLAALSAQIWVSARSIQTHLQDRIASQNTS